MWRPLSLSSEKTVAKDIQYFLMLGAVELDLTLSIPSSPKALAQAGKGKKAAPVAPVEPVQQGAGLQMAAHPLLLDTSSPVPQSKKDKYKPMQPKFASIKVSSHSFTQSEITSLTVLLSSRRIFAIHPLIRLRRQHHLSPPLLQRSRLIHMRHHPAPLQKMFRGMERSKARHQKKGQQGGSGLIRRGNMCKLRVKCAMMRSWSN